MNEPSEKKAIAFIDGQNLFRSAKEAFGYSYPNYDPVALANKICQRQKWSLKSIHFYTGVPDLQDKPFWHHFWNKKLAIMGTRGAKVFRLSFREENLK